MKFLQVIILCCFSGVCLNASEVLEVSGRVGGEVSIHCSGSWSTDNSSEYNMYLCKGVCSRENILIQHGRKRRAVTRRGRYRLDVNRGHGSFDVTIVRLKRADSGKYCCGVERSFDMSRQDVRLEVLNSSMVPPGSSPSTILQSEADVRSQGSFPSSTEPSPAALMSPITEKTNQRVTTSLTDTTVVIIVSVSLALLVCAVIPLIFYGHWRSNAGQNSQEENKGEDDYRAESKDVASAQTAVRLQPLKADADPESGAQDSSQYADTYQALDPKSLN
ncbi:hypothetical protein Q5P01_026331 [Channa striata]|uniref:Immunoglobulin domain-containing protein n=1 Tax=Channa striata TaxID=64152 RepID=A0AA88LNE6_CHASR|nr:hypothetical protein Q5P01_026331 [Channa striata]